MIATQLNRLTLTQNFFANAEPAVLEALKVRDLAKRLNSFLAKTGLIVQHVHRQRLRRARLPETWRTTSKKGQMPSSSGKKLLKFKIVQKTCYFLEALCCLCMGKQPQLFPSFPDAVSFLK